MRGFSKYFFLTLFVATFSLSFKQNVVYAEIANPATCTPRATKLDTELSYLAGQGVRGFIYWQFSGQLGGEYTQNDPYSFFMGDPMCQVLKKHSGNFDFIGVNMWGLTKEAPNKVDFFLNYLKNDCGVNMIRTWVLPETSPDDVKKVLDSAAGKGIRVIVTLKNSYGAPEGTAWFSTGYKGGYLSKVTEIVNAIRSYPALYGYELANEPHCEGDINCVAPYEEWAHDMAARIKNMDPNHQIGIGQMASQNTTRGDSPGPGDYQRSNNDSNITMTSAHYYSETEKSVAMSARSIASEMGKLFYIGEMGYECDGSVTAGPGSRTIVGRITSSRITHGENGSELSNQPVEGATVCGYHGTHMYGKEEVGTGIYGFYGSAVTDKNGAFTLESTYAPGKHYSKGNIRDADIIVVYTGQEYQEAIIVPMAFTMDDLKVDAYNKKLYGTLDLNKTLIPLDDIQTASDTKVTPAGFPANLSADGDSKCPKEAFYVNRSVYERTSCEVPPIGQRQVGKETPTQVVTNKIDLKFEGDDQYKGKINIGNDYIPLDTLPQINVPTFGKTNNKEAMPEGRFSTRQTFMALEEMRAVAGQVIGIKPITDQPKNEVDSKNAEMYTCEEIKNYMSGMESLKPRGFGIHLASPSYWADLLTDNLDKSSMAYWYQFNTAAKEMDYCWDQDGSIIKFKEVEPYDNWKEPGDTKPYKKSNDYFDPRFVYMTKGNEVELDIHADSSSTSYASPDGMPLNVKAFIYRGDRLFNEEQAGDGIFFDPDCNNEPDVPSESTSGTCANPKNMIDNAGHGYLIKNWSEIPPNTFSQQGVDLITAPQYLYSDDITPPTAYISPPFSDDVKAAQAAIGIASMETDLKSFSYSQTRYRIGVQDVLCTYSDLDGDRMDPISNGYRYVVKEVRDKNFEEGGWSEGFYDKSPKDSAGNTDASNSLFGYTTSGLWNFIGDIFQAVWSFFNVYGDNYRNANDCISKISETEVDNCNVGETIMTIKGTEGICESRVEHEWFSCTSGEEGCQCTTDVGGIVSCARREEVTKYYRVEYAPYSCSSEKIPFTDHTTVNEVDIKSRNSMIGFNYFVKLLASPAWAKPRVQTQRMYGLDTYVTSYDPVTKDGVPTEGKQGEGTIAEIGQGADVAELGKLVGDPVF